MADKELRRMNRMELIEIIYALQQNERQLREENEELRRQLDDKLLRLDSAGSIAEAALGLNYIFEDAEAAAQQYLVSLQNANEGASKILDDAQRESDTILSAAKEQARRTEAECRAAIYSTRQDIERQKASFVRSLVRLMKKYPEIGERLLEEMKK